MHNHNSKCPARPGFETGTKRGTSGFAHKSTLDKSPPPLQNLSENWLLITCVTNLSRIHENLLKLLHRQCEICHVKSEKS